MKESLQETSEILRTVLDPLRQGPGAASPGRRNFFKKLGLGATGGLLLANLPRAKGQSTSTGGSSSTQDTANEIFTAAVVAEDLATTFYYNGLIGGVITDPSLAGPGGTATSNTGNVPNVTYLRAALDQEIQHANLLRAVANLGADATTDPYQTFYFPTGTFDTISAFTSMLETLENAFIGAYLTAIGELASLAIAPGNPTAAGPYGGPYSSSQLGYFAEVAASIMGIEAEHRVLGQVILNAAQPNNLNFEQTDNLLSVYNGANSAVAALTPFLTSTTGPAYSLATALAGAATVGVSSTGNPPSSTPAVLTASPNPIILTPGSLGAVTTLTWNAPYASVIEIHVGSPTGPLFTHNVNAGSMATGAWVSNGMMFYLQDVSNGNPLTSAYTIATVTVAVQAGTE